MSRRGLVVVLVGTLGLSPALGDEILYTYEADVVPYDASARWIIGNPCEETCSESVADGHFELFWPEAGDRANYAYIIAEPPEPPPPTLWVEWRFRSNHPLGPNFYTCDGKFMVHYRGMGELVYMYGDAAISQSGNYFVTGLDIDEFHTYRFESLDGINYRIAVDGQVFIISAENVPNGYHYLQLMGHGGCLSDQIPDMLNEWDYVRYGTIDSGPSSMIIGASDPPEGYLDPDLYPQVDRFTVTFDAPNFVFTDDISVQVTGGVAPEVSWVWRRDDHGPDTVEIILDRPIPMNEATTFTFSDGRSGDTVYYTYIPQPQIPTVSTWGLTAMTLLILVAGTLVFRHIS